MRLQALGRRGRACLQELAASYRRALDPASAEHGQMRVAEQMLHVAQARLQLGGCIKARAFGLRSKDRRAAQERALAVQVRSSSACPHEAVMCLADSVDAVGSSVRSVIREARSAAIIRRRQEQESLQHDVESLAWFRENPGKNQLEAARACFPADHFTPIPTAAGSILAVDDGARVQEAVEICAVSSSKRFRRSGFSARLHEHWRDMHTTMLAGGSGSGQGTMPSAAPSEVQGAHEQHGASCIQLGFCTCTEIGQTRHRVLKALMSKLRTVCSPDSDARVMLRDGFMVWRIFSMGQDIAADEPLSVSVELWMHLGFALLSPWSLSVHMLRRAPGTHVDDSLAVATLEVVLYGSFPQISAGRTWEIPCFSLQCYEWHDGADSFNVCQVSSGVVM